MNREPEFASPGELEMPIGYGLDNPDRLEWLRTEHHEIGRVEVRIDIWDTNEVDELTGKSQLAYRLCARHEPDLWEIIFAGEEYRPGLGLGTDSDASLGCLLGFLSLKRGDTDDEYFTDYTERQLKWAEEHGEELALWSSELEEELEEANS